MGLFHCQSPLEQWRHSALQKSHHMLLVLRFPLIQFFGNNKRLKESRQLLDFQQLYRNHQFEGLPSNLLTRSHHFKVIEVFLVIPNNPAAFVLHQSRPTKNFWDILGSTKRLRHFGSVKRCFNDLLARRRCSSGTGISTVSTPSASARVKPG
ncbi:uncharacterized protein ACO6RY_15144 [Pungitius sinensis]